MSLPCCVNLNAFVRAQSAIWWSAGVQNVLLDPMAEYARNWLHDNSHCHCGGRSTGWKMAHFSAGLALFRYFPTRRNSTLPSQTDDEA